MPIIDDWSITEAMIKYGGSFVNRLGILYRFADEENEKKLKEAFSEYFEKYREIAIKYNT